MFLIAISKDDISPNFLSEKIFIQKINKSIVTVVTDDFLSKFISNDNGFSIIESPIISSSNYLDIVFSQVDYNKDNNTFNFYKSTISGRPIFYYISPKGDFFCSTHISMLRKAGVPIKENIDVLPEFFVYNYVTPPNTLYKGINQLLPGIRIIVKLKFEKCKIISIEKYCPPAPKRNVKADINNISDHTLSLINESFISLSNYKDKISVLLSGGLDSSILFKICNKNFNIKDTFSTGYPFENKRNNIEKDYAFSAAESFNVNHNFYEPTPKDYLNGFIEAIDSAEMPIHHLQSVLLHLLFKNGIPENRNIIISGEGAEGPFGWEEYHNDIYNIEKDFLNRFFMFYPLRKLINVTSKITQLMTRRAIALEKLSNINKISINDHKHFIWSMGAYGNLNWVEDFFKIRRDDIIKNKYKNIIDYCDRSIYDLLSILCFFGEDTVTQTIWSKIGEKNNKILFYPYYNQKLIDYIYSIPWNLKLNNPKNILREVAIKLNIPEYIINRPKSGFGLGTKDWAKKGGVFEPLVPLALKLFNKKQIDNMYEDHPKKSWIFWNTLNYTIWKRLHINNEKLEVLLEELNEKVNCIVIP